MNRSLHYVAAEIGVTVEDITGWIERRWVLPVRSGKEPAFDDADRARIRMILDFHRDLAIDDEAMPVVLDLVDRLHATRAQLRAVLEAVAALPEPAQTVILRKMQGEAEQ
jgi:chaperone modulatory protein CbpM